MLTTTMGMSHSRVTQTCDAGGLRNGDPTIYMQLLLPTLIRLLGRTGVSLTLGAVVTGPDTQHATQKSQGTSHME